MDRTASPHAERLWTPWRMRYISGETREEGCIFCNRLAGDDDVASLILHRGAHAFVIMNLFPYNTGHVMIVPNVHAADIIQLDDATVVELARLLPTVMAALRRVLRCDGFNAGINIGETAGAGVAEHLHQHVVPRWRGDANFMPIIAGTMVLPETIPSTYAKLRAELDRGFVDGTKFKLVLISDVDQPRFWIRNGKLPTIAPAGDLPVWQDALAIAGPGAEIVGWSGDRCAASSDVAPGLVIRIETPPPGDDWQGIPWQTDALDAANLRSDDREALTRSKMQIAPWIDAPGRS